MAYNYKKRALGDIAGAEKNLIKRSGSALSGFDAMRKITDDDMYIMGGALAVSEYENSMPPGDQKRYEEKLIEAFQNAYFQDPYRGALDFDHWLKSLNPTLIEERAVDHEAKHARNAPIEEVNPLEYTSHTIQSLAHLHTGRVEDLIRIVETLDSSAGMPQPMGYPGIGPERQGLQGPQGTAGSRPDDGQY